MYKTLIWCSSAVTCLAACLTIAAMACGSSTGVAVSQTVLTYAVVSSTPTEITQDQPAVSDEKIKEKARFDEFTAYIQEAMNSATTPDQYSVDYDQVANDLATVVLDPEEPAFWKNDKTKARTAIMMVGIAYHETNYRAYVDDGRCNDPEWRKSEEGAKMMRISGNCDGGIAHSMWQVHTSTDGIVVMPANYDDSSKDTDKREWCYAFEMKENRCATDEGKLIAPKEMASDRQAAIRVALHMARRSIRRGVKLCQYTGEGDVCPKGDVRYNWAEGPKGYSTKHPFTYSD
jgi:hypothetical protein